MPVFIASLNSGSNGNCYYIGNKREAILVDAGLSCRETERRMRDIGLSMQQVKAIFISHEHSDHIKGVYLLSRKYQLPVFITEQTYRYSGLCIESHLLKLFSAAYPVTIGALSVRSFPKLHDAAEPHSFVIHSEGINVGVFTDIGLVCEQLVKHFSMCHAAFLEANYDEDMLQRGAYPVHLKNRIRGGKGHLSNRQALELFISKRPANMSHLLLSHLSKDNNCPKLVYDLFKAHAAGTEIIIASRFEPTNVYQLSTSDFPPATLLKKKQEQLSLF